jgi:DnaJ-domain-containing protein 1
MVLGKRGWLSKLLDAEIATHRPDQLSRSVIEAAPLRSSRARARRYLRGIFRESGLLYGTPSDTMPSGGAPEEALFVAVLRTLSRIALDVAVLTEAPPAPRREQLLLLIAATFGELEDAEEIHRRVERATKSWPLPPRLWTKVEETLEGRAMSLTGDPYFGLVLHNGAIYADAQVFGRIALAYFSSSSFPRAAAERRLTFAAAQKALLVQVLIGLVCAERKPSFPTRRAILRQIDDLRLPSQLEGSVRAFAKKAFERAPSMRAVLKGVRSRDLKRFILEQTVLASLVDGRRAPRELAWVKSLREVLGVSDLEGKRIELEMAEFYARHRGVVDVFTVAAGADVMGEELVDSMQRTLEKNFQRLLKEMRETGELTVLLARAARGQKLSREERKAMREQLIDVAKTIPALAIFAAPGGVLLLIALAKVLPFNILPSAFQDEPEADPRIDAETGS